MRKSRTVAPILVTREEEQTPRLQFRVKVESAIGEPESEREAMATKYNGGHKLIFVYEGRVLMRGARWRAVVASSVGETRKSRRLTVRGYRQVKV